jgi:hypothetical protein
LSHVALISGARSTIESPTAEQAPIADTHAKAHAMLDSRFTALILTLTVPNANRCIHP